MHFNPVSTFIGFQYSFLFVAILSFQNTERKEKGNLFLEDKVLFMNHLFVRIQHLFPFSTIWVTK